MFNFKRFALLVKSDVFANYKVILVFSASVASILFLYALIFPFGAMHGNFHPTAYLWLLFLGGFWVTSNAFKDIHDKQKSYFFLTLPCSNLEKFLSKLMLTSIGYVVATLVCYYLLSLIVVGLGMLLLNFNQHVFTPFRDNILLYIRDYLILQAVFLLGAVYFKKHTMSKTILFLSCLAIIFILFTFIITALFLGPHIFTELSLISTFPAIIKVVFWIILAPCCWIITYLRLRETEV